MYSMEAAGCVYAGTDVFQCRCVYTDIQLIRYQEDVSDPGTDQTSVDLITGHHRSLPVSIGVLQLQLCHIQSASTSTNVTPLQTTSPQTNQRTLLDRSQNDNNISRFMYLFQQQ